jgi:hypothetical protein
LVRVLQPTARPLRALESDILLPKARRERETMNCRVSPSRSQQVVEDHDRQARHATKADVVGHEERTTRLSSRGRVQGVGGFELRARSQLRRLAQNQVA